MFGLTLHAPAAQVDALTDFLADACNALSVSVEDADAGGAFEEPVFDEPGCGPTGRWQHARIQALFADETSATSAAAEIASGETNASVRFESIAAVDDRDWVRLTQSQFGPTEITTGFWIVPSWSTMPADTRHTLRLDPGMAFGTGTHPTTRMCLRWMARSAAGCAAPWHRVLDYGCGSGILGIAAGLFGAVEIDAVDIDPAAVAATVANAASNNVRLAAGGLDAACGTYSLVVANILATPLRLLAPLLAAHLGEGADLLLSGVLERQADELQAAYAPWLALRVVDTDDGW